MGICRPVTGHSEVNVVITSIESNIDKYLVTRSDAYKEFQPEQHET